ncbi:hypothetical protein [Dipodfec virus UOA04_Rod_765]|nr:hypothetical protein [Dipodfec virus UOA04_Rod_765]
MKDYYNPELMNKIKDRCLNEDLPPLECNDSRVPRSQLWFATRVVETLKEIVFFASFVPSPVDLAIRLVSFRDIIPEFSDTDWREQLGYSEATSPVVFPATQFTDDLLTLFAEIRGRRFDRWA